MVRIPRYLLLLALISPLTLPAGQIYQLYSRPVAPEVTAADLEKTCAQLEQEITSLIPITYSGQSSIYEDPYVGTALVIGTLAQPMAYTYLAYPIAFEHFEQNQMGDANRRIEALRQVKAGKRCFED